MSKLDEMAPPTLISEPPSPARRGSYRSSPEANKSSTVEDGITTPPHSPSSTKHHRRSTSRRPSTKHGSPRDRPVVDHTYTDHYYDPVVVRNETGDKKLTSRGGVTTPFPVKLHRMLDPGNELDGIVAWRPHGRAFMIHDKDAFVNEIMPTVFNQSKLTSFQRQLNLYGFVRLTAPGADHGSYYHELFLRGRPDLCQRMQRTRIKGNGMKAAASPSTEPRFYEMKHCPEDAVSFLQESSDKVMDMDCAEDRVLVGEDEMDQEEVGEVNYTGEDAFQTTLLGEMPTTISPSSSLVGKPIFGGLSEKESLMPLNDRSPPKFESVTFSKNDRNMSSSQALSLASLLSPPLTQSSLPFEFPFEAVDWELGKADEGMSDCLDLAIMNEEVEEDDLLSFSCEGTGIVSQVSKSNADAQVASLVDKQEEASSGTMYFGELTQV